MILVAALLCALLLVIAGLHTYWGLGGLWPAKSAAELARTVVGDGRMLLATGFMVLLSREM